MIEDFKRQAEEIRFKLGQGTEFYTYNNSTNKPYKFTESTTPLNTIKTKLDDPKLAPSRSNPTDAGADLRSKENCIIFPNCTALVDTGVALKIPVGYVGLVLPRSSMGKVRVTLANGTGVIDSDYRGNIKVLLANDGGQSFEIKAFDTRIAQILIVPVMLADFKQTNEEWLDTARGEGGFGSTGK